MTNSQLPDESPRTWERRAQSGITTGSRCGRGAGAVAQTWSLSVSPEIVASCANGSERDCVVPTSRSTPALASRCGWSKGHSRAPIWLQVPRAALYCRFAIGWASGLSGGFGPAGALQNAILRYGRVQLCATRRADLRLVGVRGCTRRMLFSLGILYLWLSVITAGACSIPVFRYALDRWAADSYRLEIPARAATNPAISGLLRNLGDSSSVNLRAVTSTNRPESRLLFPGDETSVWSGTLNPTVFAELTNSPTRGEIVRRLLAGESGVWILVESGRGDLDNSEAVRLEKRLRFLETVAALPAMDPADPSNELGPGPALRVGFSVLRLPSDDQREVALRKMLVRAGPEDRPASDGPIAAVVFGRGRVLGAWPMKELNDESIDEACLFLLGACSCQVKGLNPGWDLLLSVDWDQALHAVAAAADADPDPKSDEKLQVATPVETVTIHPNADVDQSQPRNEFRRWRTVLGLSAAGISAAAALILLRLKRST